MKHIAHLTKARPDITAKDLLVVTSGLVLLYRYPHGPIFNRKHLNIMVGWHIFKLTKPPQPWPAPWSKQGYKSRVPTTKERRELGEYILERVMALCSNLAGEALRKEQAREHSVELQQKRLET